MWSGLQHHMVTRFQEQAPPDDQAEVISLLMTCSHRSIQIQKETTSAHLSLRVPTSSLKKNMWEGRCSGNCLGKYSLPRLLTSWAEASSTFLGSFSKWINANLMNRNWIVLLLRLFLFSELKPQWTLEISPKQNKWIDNKWRGNTR